MTEPATEFLRRSQVMDWLGPEGLGFTRSYVRELLAQKIIKGAPLPGRKASTRPNKAEGQRLKAKVESKKRNGSGNGAGEHHRGRQVGALVNYYRKSEIKRELGL